MRRPARRRANPASPTRPPAFAGQPATVLDGALKDVVSANAVTPAASSDPSQSSSLNLLV